MAELKDGWALQVVVGEQDGSSGSEEYMLELLGRWTAAKAYIM